MTNESKSSSDVSEDQRVTYVVEWAGQSPHGLHVIDATADPRTLIDNLPPKLRLVFPSGDLPYRTGSKFFAEAFK